jgi:hypothetical protein
MNNQKVIICFLAIATYLISAGISYSIFASTTTGTTSNSSSTTSTNIHGNDYEALEFLDSEPKTEVCPLNGVKYSKKQKEWWSKHRPLGVMIENHEEARPQSGLNGADVIYEAVAEGGITRFLSVFYCQDAGIVGPVRSARVYFLDYISEYGNFPLYAHVGGANTPGPANALGQIADMDWVGYNDMNEFSLGLPTFKRDESRLGHQVATEHTMYSSTSKLWAVGEKRGLTNVDDKGVSWDESFEPYTFKEDKPSSGVKSVHIEYWKGYDNYAVDWTYNKKDNTYLRKNGGDVHSDRNTKEQLKTKNVVLLFMAESNANDGYENNLHMIYKTKGKGNATVFMDGKEIKATWQKATRDSRTKLFAADGSELEFNRGKIWFHILPLDGVVETE